MKFEVREYVYLSNSTLTLCIVNVKWNILTLLYHFIFVFFTLSSDFLLYHCTYLLTVQSGVYFRIPCIYGRDTFCSKTKTWYETLYRTVILFWNIRCPILRTHLERSTANKIKPPQILDHSTNELYSRCFRDYGIVAICWERAVPFPLVLFLFNCRLNCRCPFSVWCLGRIWNSIVSVLVIAILSN